MKYAVYGEQFGRMMLVEDGFESLQEAWDFVVENMTDANYRIRHYESKAEQELRSD